MCYMVPSFLVANYKLPHIRSLDTHFAWNPYPLSDAPYPYKMPPLWPDSKNFKIRKGDFERGIVYLSMSDEVGLG